jgi:heat shock protein HtpX
MIKNQVKTAVLLAALSGVLLFVGYLIGGYSGLTIALILAVTMNLVTYWFSDKIVLAMYRAKPIKKQDAPGIYKIVKEISQKMGIPKPKIYFVPSDINNAFAVGRSPKKSAIAFTRGILNLLNKEEIKGVAAHELSHIKNRDTLIAVIAATIAAIISYVAFMARFAAIFGGMRDREGGRGLELLVLAIITPILAMIIQLAISRAREYLADERAAKTLKTGKGLASALEKLEASTKLISLRPTGATESTAHLFIVNPFRGKGIFTFFSTHPSVEARVKKLRSMSF